MHADCIKSLTVYSWVESETTEALALMVFFLFARDSGRSPNIYSKLFFFNIYLFICLTGLHLKVLFSTVLPFLTEICFFIQGKLYDNFLFFIPHDFKIARYDNVRKLKLRRC